MGILGRLFNRKPQPPASLLDKPLLLFSEHDVWRIRDACEGVQIFGFNFLNYEYKRPGAGAGLTENLVSLFCNVLEVAERKTSASSDSYWERALKQLLRNTVDLITTAKDSISLQEMYDVISSAPQSIEQTHSEDWQNSSLCYAYVAEGDEKITADPSHPKAHDFKMAAKFWLSEFPTLAEKTRSIIVSTFTSMADCFLRGTLRPLFCTETNILPEMTHEGAIIVLDLPVKEFADLGQFAQVLFKYMWQGATERRDTDKHPRPVFLWADEAQYFVTASDMSFQTPARSSRACTVYLTQNLPNYYAMLSGDKGKNEVNSLLGNLQTKIFHANGDQVTNHWAAELFAKNLITRVNASSTQAQQTDIFNVLGLSPGGQQQGGSTTAGTSQTVDYEVPPREFIVLKKGGPQNNLCVEGLIFQTGRIWSGTGKTNIKAVFRQD